ncbi:hypothetical protein PVAP13_1KG191177 [Panicum virgatum]|uniref:Uncharacterized protein n=1 Tax=Panicum virgatum TaxID=38727 RepID=A0A8T0X6H8_PANVG|nr:hypothetical protein PVAP13_1KG191177 [Panicum virgatum]
MCRLMVGRTLRSGEVPRQPHRSAKESRVHSRPPMGARRMGSGGAGSDSGGSQAPSACSAARAREQLRRRERFPVAGGTWQRRPAGGPARASSSPGGGPSSTSSSPSGARGATTVARWGRSESSGRSANR